MESGQQTEGAGGNDEEIRAGMRAMWGIVAPGWEQNADFVDRRGARHDRRNARRGESEVR